MSRPRRLPCLLSALGLVVALPPAAGAVTLSWNNAAGGPASTPGNWAPAGVPGPGDPVVFNLPGIYPVMFDALVPSSASHTYRSGQVTLTMASPHTLSGSVTAGTLPGDSPGMDLRGTLSAPLSSAIGSAAGTNATFRVAGPDAQFLVTNPGADLRVGFSGTGTLRVEDGGLVQVNDDLRLAEQGGSSGTVIVDGAASTVRTQGAAGDILVGISGTALLDITAGGAVVAAGAVRVGSAGGATGRLHVDDGTLNAGSVVIFAPGRLEGRGTVQTPLCDNRGTIAAGNDSFGTLAFVGAYAESAGATLALDVGGSSAGAFDRVTVSGAARLAGTLRLEFPAGATLTPGVALPLVTASAINGAFANVVVVGFPHPAALALTYTPTEVLLTLQAAVDVPSPPKQPAVLAFRGVSGSGAPAFRLDLPDAAEVRVELFTATGRRVHVLADRGFPAGSHRLGLPAPPRGLTPGVYFGRAIVRVRNAAGGPRRLSDRILLDGVPRLD